MALSNLSDKTLQPEHLRKGHEAALELLSVLNAKLVTADGSPHAASILSAAAWLTGTNLCQSFRDKKISLPSTVITPQYVNREWEALVYLLEEDTLKRSELPIGRIVLAAMATPHTFRPQVEMSYVQSELQEHYSSVMQKHSFDSLASAHVGVVLCSILIQQYSRDGIIDMDVAIGIAAQRIFEAARQCVLP